MNGQTAGDNTSGPIGIRSWSGIRLLDHGSFVTYPLAHSLQEGEFSMMILNADEGNPGDKSKIFSMQEGPDVNDITTDDYRPTTSCAGATTARQARSLSASFRATASPRDAHRSQVNLQQQIVVLLALHVENRVPRVSKSSRAGRAVRTVWDFSDGQPAATHIGPVRTTSISVRLPGAPASSTPRCRASSSRTCGRPHAHGRHSPANSRQPGTTTRGRRERAQPLSLLPFTFSLLCLRGRPRVTLS